MSEPFTPCEECPTTEGCQERGDCHRVAVPKERKSREAR